MTPVVSDEYSYSHLLGFSLARGRADAEGRPDAAGATVPPQVAEEAAVSLRLLEFGWVRWGEHFPQSGPGRSDEHAVALEPWQQAIVDREPEAFLRGLIAADGRRVMNRFTTTLRSGRVAAYAYPRYFFSHGSADVRRLFCACCERIGLDWTKSSTGTVSVANRQSVAALDALVTPGAWRGGERL